MCHADADCHAPLSHCDLSGGSADGHCVQCLFDTDCDAPLVCDPTKKRCEECVPGATNNTQCRPELTGSQCLTDGRCGCLVDGDCGGAQSGRVCDATTSRCVPGCRGTGGNACPMEQVCSSTTDEIGRCNPAPTSDGGVDGSTDGGTDGGADAIGDGGNGDGPTDGRDGAIADTGGTDGGGVDARDGSSNDTTTRPDGAMPDTGGGGEGGDSGVTPVGLDRFIAGGGCHCATGGEQGGPWAWVVGLVGLAVMLRRRRR
jgi:MYXO-CTERM domain-containing protein